MPSYVFRVHFVFCFLMLAVALTPAPPAEAQEKPEAPSDVIWERNIVYSQVGGRVAMDVVRPREGTGPFPTVVCVHGGGFRAGTRQGYLPLAFTLAQKGYVAATVSYRLSPMAQFPAHVHDVKAAVRFLRANANRFQIDPDRIGATGGSAGGHLVLFLGLTADVDEFEGSGPHRDQSSAVQAVVNFYGPTDFTASYGKSVDAAEVLPLFLGGDLEHARALHIKASPLNWVTPNAAPTLTIHGTEDDYVAHEHAQWLTDRFEAAGVDNKLLTLEGAGHGFKGKHLDMAHRAMFEWFDKQLAARPKQRVAVVADHGPAGEVVAMEWPSGRELWTLPNNRGHDVQILPNGNVLYTTGSWGRVVEVDSDRKEVWSYGPTEGLEHAMSAQRLPNGNTLIGDAVLGRVFEVTPAREVVWEYESPELGDMQMRNSRRTAQGTTLISVERLNKFIEVNRAGEIIWTYKIEGGDERFPYQAHRLPNGNTLISHAAPGQIVEVTPQGEVVRSIGGDEMSVRMAWTSGIFPLAGGGVFASDYTGRRLIEFDAKGTIVNELRMGRRTVASVAMK